LSAEQIAAVEALTRGLVNKFLHPPMQALKQAAREGDQVKLDAVCEEWSVSVQTDRDAGRDAVAAKIELKTDEQAAGAGLSAAGVETHQ